MAEWVDDIVKKSPLCGPGSVPDAERAFDLWDAFSLRLQKSAAFPAAAPLLYR